MGEGRERTVLTAETVSFMKVWSEKDVRKMLFYLIFFVWFERHLGQVSTSINNKQKSKNINNTYNRLTTPYTTDTELKSVFRFLPHGR